MKRLPGSSQEEENQANRKRQASCEEESEGQPSKKKAKAGHSKDWATEKTQAGQQEQEAQVCNRPCCPSFQI